MTTATTTPKAKSAAKTTAAKAKPVEAAPVEAAPVEAVAAPVETVAPAVVPAAEVIEQAVAVGKDTLEQVVKASQDAAAKGYDQAVAVAKDQVEAVQKVQAQAVKSSEEALAAAKENLDAVVKAGQMLAQGLQDLSKSVVVLTQEAVEESVASTKKLLGAKSLHEAVDIHSAHAKAQIDRLLSEGARLSDSTRKLFEEALAPVQSRLQATVDKISNLTKH